MASAFAGAYAHAAQGKSQPMVGEVLADRYEVEELVGAGGMSSVYRAHDRLLDRKVALKVLHQQFGDDEEYVERFRREARAVATLSHPNIVTVIDRGEHAGRQFIVFEYIDGSNLKQLLERRGPVPIDYALEIAIQVARALSFAHQNGLVHRDVKPQNVLLNGDGRAKVTDFGIARSLDVKHGMTQTGTVLGTSDYIAPEQAQGQQVAALTDVYSLGVVVYELLTNEVPFPAENFVAVAMRHINEPPPPIRDKRPEVSPRLEDAVQCAMAKDPDDRFASMSDFCGELEACLNEVRGGGSGSHTVVMQAPRRGVAPRSRRRGALWPILVLLVALGVAAAVVGWAISRDDGGGNAATTSGGGGGTAAVHLSGVSAYDPYGTGGEHDAEAPRATDNDAATYWTTEQYHDGLAAIGKKGVGLVLDAGRPVTLNQIGVVTSTPGFKAEIKGGSSTTSFPTTVSGSQEVGSTTRFDITGGRYRYYLLWITELAPGYDSVRVNEVRAD